MPLGDSTAIACFIPVYSLVGWLPVVACVGVFSWLPLCGVVGLRWGADVTRLCVCLLCFPALVPACVYRPTISSVCNALYPCVRGFLVCFHCIRSNQHGVSSKQSVLSTDSIFVRWKKWLDENKAQWREWISDRIWLQKHFRVALHPSSG